jgi:hypothetical protein
MSQVSASKTRIAAADRGSNEPGEFPESGRRTGLL